MWTKHWTASSVTDYECHNIESKHQHLNGHCTRWRGCTQGTRENILANLKDWAEDQSSPKVYWMEGMAGTGKTTIMYSFCEILNGNQQLGANFCCSRLIPSCRDANLIVPTLVSQLAAYSPSFRSSLCKVLSREQQQPTELNIPTQLKRLLGEPLKAAKAFSVDVVIVIDAMDECQDSSLVQLLLDALLESTASLPLKYFITSQPEFRIRDKMLAQHRDMPSILHLHDIKQSIVEADIHKYLLDTLGNIFPPLPLADIQLLTKHAGKLFIYAATAAQYINPGP
ncbi:hypothetical protein H0H87_002973 [Tephrocybe sp. NHM501043]|nr:hypothetical protein H0H87_002973 [Tephrocybe sp. NHM501043]